MSRRVGANLTVIMPGYSNPDDIARALTQAINSDVAGEQRYARSDFAIARGATGRSLLNGLGRQYVRLQAQAATENALNTVGGSAGLPFAGTILRYAEGVVEEVGDFFDDAWDEVEDWF